MNKVSRPFAHLGWGVRFAFAVVALIAAVPILLVIGNYGLLPGVVVQGFEFSGVMAAVTLISTLILFGFGYFAVTGQNPLEKLDEAAAKRRAEIEAHPEPMIPNDVPAGRALAGLFVGSILFAVISLIPEIIFLPFRDSPKGWAGWLGGIAFLVGLFWYATFVIVSKDRGWFGPARRIIHGAVLAGVVVLLARHDSAIRMDVLWWASAAFVLGVFAEKLVKGL